MRHSVSLAFLRLKSFKKCGWLHLMIEIMQNHWGQTALIVTVAFFFLKMAGQQKEIVKTIGQILHQSEDAKSFLSQMANDHLNSKTDDVRQQKLCKEHAQSINKILQKQDRQYSSQQHMEKLIDNNNIALSNVTIVLNKLLIVIETQSNGKIH